MGQRIFSILGATTLLSALVCSTPIQASCELERPVRLAGMSWLSNQVTVAIQRQILEQGYGCQTEEVIGGTLPMIMATIRGDVDVMNEIWPNSVAKAWNKAVSAGKVEPLGSIYSGGVEGWYVPAYLASAQPTLTDVASLKRHAALFADSEAPGKGRFYNCPVGWSCEVVNDNLLRALQLDAHYNAFSTGSGAALEAAVVSAYKRKQPILFYYWGPSPLLGQYEFTRLAMPAYNAQAHQCNLSSDCEQPEVSDFPVTDIINGANSEFVAKAPQLSQFFRRFNIPTEQFNQVLGWAAEQKAEPSEVAANFIKTRRDLWQQWVPRAVAERLDDHN